MHITAVFYHFGEHFPTQCCGSIVA